jgi:putative mRNA 3-end processing factor
LQKKENLLTYTSYGLYCPEGNFYIDPKGRVENAVITHTHSDHLKRGHKNYLSHHISVPIIKHRVGPDPSITGKEYGEVTDFNGVKVSLHPAGHMPGSAQIKVEYKGEVWVVSGDYKTEDDNLNRQFEPVKCHTFITESTFASPAYKWRPQNEIFGQINSWWMQNTEAGQLSILTGYSLGKAQRLLKNVDHSLGNIFGHEEIYAINNLFKKGGLGLPELMQIKGNVSKNIRPGSMIIAPPSVIGSPWLDLFGRCSVAFASGWMQPGSGRMRKGIDRGFALSDHADWEGLNWAVKETGAEDIYVTHGYVDVFVNWLRKIGYNAYDLKTLGKNHSPTQTKQQMELF